MKTKKKLIPRKTMGGGTYGIPKGQSGWIAYLNPKNWGVKDYTTENFSLAFNLAEAEGEKEFLWRGKRYAVKRAADYNKELEWFKNYINNYKLEDVLLSRSDSTNAEIRADEKAWNNYLKIDSLRLKLYDSRFSPEVWEQYRLLLDSLLDDNARIRESKYETARKDKLQKVKKITNWYKYDRSRSAPWLAPGYFVRDLSRATGADLLQTNYRSPREEGARKIENTYLKEQGLPVEE